MSKPSILITGGAGFIGSHFIRAVIEATDWQIINLDKLTYAGNLESLREIPSNRHHFVHGDILDTALVSSLLQQHDPQFLVHFAAESHVDRSIDAPTSFVQTNVVGTCSLLEAVRHQWPHSSQNRFLHVSTDEVFGSLGDTGKFHEHSPYQPRSPYAASKAASDHFVRAYFETYGLPVLLTNCSNNYGPNQFPEKLVPLMTLNALERKPLPVYGGGQQIRDWLYVRDHANALLKILQHGRLGETYNIGGARSDDPVAREYTNLSVVEMICDLVDELQDGAATADQPTSSARELIRFVEDRPGHDQRYAMDCSKLRAELGWQPTTSFADGLRETVRWYMEHEGWVNNVRSGSYQGQRLGLG